MPAWLMIGIIPAATARETPHALRIETTLPIFQIIIAYGVIVLLSRVWEYKLRKNFKLLIVILNFALLTLNFIYYLHGYYVHYPIEYSGEWQYGYREAIEYAESVKNDYNKIVFTKALGRPYIYLLFYGKYKPEFFRKSAKIEREVLGFVHVNSFGKYIFTKDPNGVSQSKGKTLYINTPKNVSESTAILKKINLLDGNPSLVAYE